GKTNFEVVAFGPNSFDLNRFTRRLRWGDNRFRSEVERNAKNVGIFDIEKPFLVEIVRLATQRTANDLLAQKLGAEGANAENVSDRVGVPAFSEHRNRHNT